MISFWVNEAGSFGIETYLANRGAPIRELFAVQHYNWREEFDVPAGTQIFAALDRLSEAEREAVATLFDQLTRLQPGTPVLNDPRRCLLRRALLERMADEGLNDFRVFPAQEVNRVARFPVFVREASDHSGSLTVQLHSPAALRRSLLALRVRGYRVTDLLIVEYCDTSDHAGIFRKYSAFKIGNTIVPTHLLASREWVVKAEAAERSLEFAREEQAYVEQNPYAEWLQKVFSLAGIDYGRIDYGVLRGRPQLWEINLNPTVGRGQRTAVTEDPEIAEVRNRTREHFHSNLRNAFAALDRPGHQGPLTLRLDRPLLQRIARTAEAIRRREAAFGVFRGLYHARRVGEPLRALLARLFPRG